MLFCHLKKIIEQAQKILKKEKNLFVRLTIVVWGLTACNLIIVLIRQINTEDMCNKCTGGAVIYSLAGQMSLPYLESIKR